MIRIGDFLPDAGDFSNDGVIEAQNVLPEVNGYSPWRKLEAFSTSLPTTAFGAATYRQAGPGVFLYAASKKHLYGLPFWDNISRQINSSGVNFAVGGGGTSTISAAGVDMTKFKAGEKVSVYGSALNDVTYDVQSSVTSQVVTVQTVVNEIGSGLILIAINHETTSDNKRWEFAKYDEQVIAVNFNLHPQVADLVNNAEFSDLTVDFFARHVGIVRTFVVCGYTSDAVDGLRPNRIRWSSITDPSDFVVSAVTQSDFVDIQGSPGEVRFIGSGEYGIVITERSVIRMTYVGAPEIFQIDEAFTNVGAATFYGQAQYGNRIFFLSADGFKMVIDGVRLEHIGANKIDNWFFNLFDFENANRTHCGVDPGNTRVIWAAPLTVGPEYTLIIYDWTLDRWSYVYEPARVVFTTLAREGTGPFIDEVGYFNDSDQYALVGASATTAILTTGEIELSQGRKSMVRNIRINAEGGTPEILVGSRNTQSSAVSWSTTLPVTSDGSIPYRNTSRYHRVKILLDNEWDYLYGYDINFKSTRRKF